MSWPRLPNSLSKPSKPRAEGRVSKTTLHGTRDGKAGPLVEFRPCILLIQLMWIYSQGTAICFFVFIVHPRAGTKAVMALDERDLYCGSWGSLLPTLPGSPIITFFVASHSATPCLILTKPRALITRYAADHTEFHFDGLQQNAEFQFAPSLGPTAATTVRNDLEKMGSPKRLLIGIWLAVLCLMPLSSA